MEGLIEGDTVEDLLKEQNLTLEATISKCRALEAARQQCEEITHTIREHTCPQCKKTHTTTSIQHSNRLSWMWLWSSSGRSSELPSLSCYLPQLSQNLPFCKSLSCSNMHSLGRLLVTLRLGDRTIVEDFQIYTEVSMTIISWKTSKYLSILPEHYPQPTPHQMVTLIKTMPPNDIRAEFPQVFDGQIKTMEGELFHIALTAKAKPFCVHAPRTIPYAFRDR